MKKPDNISSPTLTKLDTDTTNGSFELDCYHGDWKAFTERYSSSEIIIDLVTQYCNYPMTPRTMALKEKIRADYAKEPLETIPTLPKACLNSKTKSKAKGNKGKKYQDPNLQWPEQLQFLLYDRETPKYMTERRGGITWIKSGTGILIPCIENTWLKHMLVNFLPDREVAQNFIVMLQESLEEAVKFLYDEGIKPYLGDVANQMKRIIPDNFWSASEVAFISLLCKDKIHLRSELRVKGEMGWVLYLDETPSGFEGFVDTHSPEDKFSYYHWRALNKFVVKIMTADEAAKRKEETGLSGSQGFTGGRYAFAERLRNEVKLFKDMRLGEVVHLVQLAIYSGVFVYSQRVLLPVSACEKSAEEMFPGVTKPKQPVCGTLEDVERIIATLVDNRKNGLVLAQLKQQFMLQFNKELDPNTFGFRKLQDLLLSSYFAEKYRLFVPLDSPHRTHIQNVQYPLPLGCRLFEKAKLEFDQKKFSTSICEWHDEPTPDITLESLPDSLQSMLLDILDSDDEKESAELMLLRAKKGEIISLDDISTDIPLSYLLNCCEETRRDVTSPDRFSSCIYLNSRFRGRAASV